MSWCFQGFATISTQSPQWENESVASAANKILRMLPAKESSLVETSTLPEGSDQCAWPPQDLELWDYAEKGCEDCPTNNFECSRELLLMRCSLSVETFLCDTFVYFHFGVNTFRYRVTWLRTIRSGQSTLFIGKHKQWSAHIIRMLAYFVVRSCCRFSFAFGVS